MRAIPILFALPVMAYSTVAGAQSPAWTVRAGWEYTSLGDARPGGFGSTGGHTGRLSLERAILCPSESTSIAAIGELRAWGLEQPGPRTVGVEADLGVSLAYDVRLPRLLEQPIRLGLIATIGGYRAPLATAIGPMRFLGVRPAFGAFASYASAKGATIRIGADLRYYDTLVWSGLALSAGASGGWTW